MSTKTLSERIGATMQGQFLNGAVVCVLSLGMAAAHVAAQELTKSGEPKTLDEWIQELRGPDAKRRDDAVQQIIKLGPNAKRAIPSLVESLSPGSGIRTGAARALANFGPAAQAAVPQLRKNLIDSSPLVRMSAAFALGRILPESDEGATALVEELKSKDLTILCFAGDYLTRLSGRAIPALAKASTNAEPKFAAQAVEIMCLMYEVEPSARKQLSQPLMVALKHESGLVRYTAANGLLSYVSDSTGFETALKALANDPEERVRKAAALAIKNVPSK